MLKLMLNVQLKDLVCQSVLQCAVIPLLSGSCVLMQHDPLPRCTCIGAAGTVRAAICLTQLMTVAAVIVSAAEAQASAQQGASRTSSRACLWTGAEGGCKLHSKA
jgi:hypothetical protein